MDYHLSSVSKVQEICWIINFRVKFFLKDNAQNAEKVFNLTLPPAYVPDSESAVVSVTSTVICCVSVVYLDIFLCSGLHGAYD